MTRLKVNQFNCIIVEVIEICFKNFQLELQRTVDYKTQMLKLDWIFCIISFAIVLSRRLIMFVNDEKKKIDSILKDSIRYFGWRSIDDSRFTGTCTVSSFASIKTWKQLNNLKQKVVLWLATPINESVAVTFCRNGLSSLTDVRELRLGHATYRVGRRLHWQPSGEFRESGATRGQLKLGR